MFRGSGIEKRLKTTGVDDRGTAVNIQFAIVYPLLLITCVFVYCDILCIHYLWKLLHFMFVCLINLTTKHKRE